MGNYSSSYDLSDPIFIAAHVVAGLMTILCMFTFVTLVLIALECRREKRERKWRSSTLLYILIFLLTLVRSVYGYIPAEVWVNLMNDLNGAIWKQMVCDQIPEVIYLLAYLLAVCSWVETYAKVKFHSSYNRKRNFWLSYVSLSFFIVCGAAAVIVTANLQEWQYEHGAQIDGAYIAGVALLILVSSLIFGTLVLRLFNIAGVLTPRILQQMRRFRMLVLFISLAMALKAVYLLTLSNLATEAQMANKISKASYAAIFFFYYFCAEIVPSSLVLWTLYRERQSSVKKQDYKELEEDPVYYHRSGKRLMADYA